MGCVPAWNCSRVSFHKHPRQQHQHPQGEKLEREPQSTRVQSGLHGNKYGLSHSRCVTHFRLRLGSRTDVKVDWVAGAKSQVSTVQHRIRVHFGMRTLFIQRINAARNAFRSLTSSTCSTNNEANTRPKPNTNTRHPGFEPTLGTNPLRNAIRSTTLGSSESPQNLQLRIKFVQHANQVGFRFPP